MLCVYVFKVPGAYEDNIYYITIKMPEELYFTILKIESHAEEILQR